MNGRVEAVYGLFEVSGTGQRREVVLQSFLEFDEVRAAGTEVGEGFGLLDETLHHLAHGFGLLGRVDGQHLGDLLHLVDNVRRDGHRLLFLLGEHLGMTRDGTLESLFEPLRHLLLLSLSGLDPLGVGFLERLLPEHHLLFDELFSGLQEDLGILPHDLDELSAVSGDAFEAVG